MYVCMCLCVCTCEQELQYVYTYRRVHVQVVCLHCVHCAHVRLLLCYLRGFKVSFKYGNFCHTNIRQAHHCHTKHGSFCDTNIGQAHHTVTQNMAVSVTQKGQAHHTATHGSLVTEGRSTHKWRSCRQKKAGNAMEADVASAHIYLTKGPGTHV